MTVARLAGLVLIGAWLLGDPAAVHQSTAVPIIMEASSAPGTFLHTPDTREFTVDVDGSPAFVDWISFRSTLNVLLLVDMSLSAAIGETEPVSFVAKSWRGYDTREMVQLLTREVVDRLLPRHRLRVARFGVSGSVDTTWVFTQDRTEAIRDVQALVGIDTQKQTESFGPSPIWDAVAASADVVSRADGPGAIILVTDGASTGNWLSMEEVASLAAARRILVHVVFRPRFLTSGEPIMDPGATGDGLLRQLAAQTGGLFRGDYARPPRALHALAPDGRRPAFADVAAAIMANGTIGVRTDDPFTDGRAISVGSTRTDVRVHAPRWLRAHAPAVSANAPFAIARPGEGDPAFVRDADGATALYRAAAANQLAIVQDLLARLAEVDAPRLDGQTPLMAAAFRGHRAVVQQLIDRGADVNARSRQGFTALSQAIRSGDVSLVQLLLARGAETRRADAAGRTPADVAFATHRDDILKTVLTAGFGRDPDPPAVRDVEAAVRAAIHANLAVSSYYDLRVDVKGVVRSQEQADERTVYAVVQLQDRGRDLDTLDGIRRFTLQRTASGWEASLVLW